jgi:Ca2+-binding RTX toxin-like protein
MEPDGMATTFNVIFLGVSAIDIDPTEGNTTSEDMGLLVGTTFGSGGAPLYDAVQTLSPVGNPGATYESNNNPDQFSVDGTTYTFDGWGVYNATLTYADGTTATVVAKIAQTTTGELYLTPDISSQQANQALFEAKPILSLTLNSTGPQGTGMTADRLPGNFIEPVDGTAGNDSMVVGYTDADGDMVTDGADVIRAGDGDDTIHAGDGDDVIFGGAGNDLIDDWNGNDLVYAGAGNDTVDVSTGNDTVYGGDGDDLVNLWDNAGTNELYGGDGFDTLDFQNWQSTDGASVTFNPDGSGSFSHFAGATTGTFEGFDSVSGTDYADTMDASSATSGVILDGEGGNDFLTGGAGDDTLIGGAGNDTLSGNAGADTIDGGDGADQIQGGQGGDSISGGAGADFILGDGQWYAVADYAAVSNGAATNLTIINSADGPIELWWIDETGTLQFYATIQPGETHVQSTFEDHNWVLRDELGYYLELIEGAANQTVNYGAEGLADSIAGGGANDTIYGQFGDDTIGGGAGSDLIFGGSGNDSLRGGEGDDTIYGGDGNDTIDVDIDLDLAYGDAGDDLLIDGSFGNRASTLYGGDGNDTIQSGTGTAAAQYYGDAGDDLFEDRGGDNQTYFGGAGSDTYVALTGIGNDTIIGGEDPGDTDTDLIDLSALNGPVTVAFTGDEAGTITDGTGTLTFSEIEEIQLGSGNDTVDASADTSGVIVDGGAGHDRFTGGSGDDIFYGGSGSDYFYSSAGNDTFYGGDGWDYAFITGTLGNHHIDLGVQDPVAANSNDWINFTFAETLDLTYTGTGGSVTNGTDTLTFNEVDGWSGTFDYGGTFDARALTDYGVGVDITGGWATIYGSAQDDMFWLNGSDDRWLDGGAGNDYIAGDAGNDSFDGGADNDILEGWGGNDSLIGGAGDDTIYGGAGDDTIYGGAGDDFMDGGADADTFIIEDGFGNDTIIGGDTVTTGQNYDTIDLSALSNPVVVIFSGPNAGTITDIVTGDVITFSGIEGLILTAHDDVVDATLDDGSTSIYAGDGNDTLTGSNGGGGGGYNGGLFGGAGDDVIYSGSGDDWIEGGDGNDTIVLGGGADIVQGQGGADTYIVGAGFGGTHIDGGGGNDLIDLNGLPNGVEVVFSGPRMGTITDRVTGEVMTFENIAHLILTEHDDIVDATLDDGTTLIEARDGDDSIRGSAGNDILYGGDGADTFTYTRGEGVDTIIGGEGGTDLDTLQLVDATFGGTGATITYTSAEAGSFSFDLGSGTFSEIEIVRGTESGDAFLGGAATTGFLAYGEGGFDFLQGGSGDDTLYGGTGGDSIRGGAGADLLYGDEGNDILRGDEGNDTLFGGDGNDSLDGGTGDDQLFGGTGNDTLQGGAGNDSLFGGDGSDTAVFTGVVTDYSFALGGAGQLIVTDSVAGRDGQDTLEGFEYITFNGVTYHLVTGDDGGNITLQGPDDGTPTLIIAHGGNDLGVGQDTSDAMFGGAGDDTLEGGNGDDTLIGEGGNDLLRGDGGNDLLFGGDGSDTLEGGAGDDTLIGGDGQNYLYGGDGADSIVGHATDPGSFTIMYGGAGADTLDGTVGWWDVASYFDSDAGVNVNLQDDLVESGGDAQGDTLIGIEQVDGSNLHGDTIVADDSGMLLKGWGGDDSLVGGAGNDWLEGGTGNDTLEGGGGDDRLIGGDGDDSLIGGAGDDLITTGAGADTVVLADGHGNDTVTDFDMTLVSGRTVDRLDVSAMTNANGDPVTWRDVTVTDTVGDGTGNAILTFPGGESVTLMGVTPDQVDSMQEMAAIGIPCFAAGTLIETPEGPRPVEALAAGDVVMTEAGSAPVIWAGARRLRAADLSADPGLRPVHFARGAIGNRLPLRLSPQHAVQVPGAGGRPVLVRAKHLAEAGLPGLRIARGVRSVRYHHLLLPRHAILSASGARVESMYPGPMALAAFPLAARLPLAAAILRARPSSDARIVDLADLSRIYGPRCLPLLSRRDALRLCGAISAAPFAPSAPCPASAMGR